MTDSAKAGDVSSPANVNEWIASVEQAIGEVQAARSSDVRNCRAQSDDLPAPKTSHSRFEHDGCGRRNNLR